MIEQLGPWVIVAVLSYGSTGHVTALDSFPTRETCETKRAWVSRGTEWFPPTNQYECWRVEWYNERRKQLERR